MIEVKMYEDAADKCFVVRVGPEGHVCSETEKFYYLTDNREEAWTCAHMYSRGALNAIRTCSGLTTRFLEGNFEEID